LILAFSLVTVKEESIVISIIEYQDPFATFFVAEPSVNQSQDMCLWLIPTGKFDPIRDCSIAFLESRCGAGMDPEDPGLWVPLPHLV
jgi:hypothetical protein